MKTNDASFLGNSQVEGSEIRVARDNLRVFTQGRVVDAVDDAREPIAAAHRKDGADFGVANHGIELAGPLVVSSSQIPDLAPLDAIWNKHLIATLLQALFVFQ